MTFELFQTSVTGGRRLNQDRVGQSRTARALLMVLADGMGGTPRGEVAADLAVQGFLAAFEARAKPVIEDPGDFFWSTATGIHDAIHRYAREQRLWDVPGTTVSVCLVQDGAAYCAHVGDSRCYLFRDGQVHTRSRDHSLYQEMMEGGQLSEDDGLFHPERSILTNCLGGIEPPFVEIGVPLGLQLGDVLLLCSDGFWGPLPDLVMARALAQQPLADALSGLVQQAEEIAGSVADNISVIAVRWEGVQPDAV